MAGAGKARDSDRTALTDGGVKRAQIPIRTTEATRDRLLRAAAANGRSLTQELEQRLERSLVLEDELGGAEGLELFRAMAAAAKAAGGFGTPWRSDIASYARMRTALIRGLDALQPTPRELLDAIEQLITVVETGDKQQRVAAARAISNVRDKIATELRKGRTAANAAVDIMQGITADDRAGADAGIDVLERLMAGAEK